MSVGRRIVLELAAVTLLFVVAGYVWLHPASAELLAGNRSLMVGDDTDSVTNVWQYQIVLDTFRESPLHLFTGALFTDQMVFPGGHPVWIPFSERLVVLLLSPFLAVDLMPTAVVWTYLVLAGVSMHACGRLFGWSRVLAFAVGLAWAICPYTRARAEVHIALDGVYFAPMALAAVRVLAGAPKALGWSSRTETAAAALLFFGAVSTAHYYVMLLVGFTPALAILYAALRPPAGAVRRLAIALVPATLLLFTTAFAPLPASEAARVALVAPGPGDVRAVNARELKLYGAEPIDYLGGDVRFGDRDLNPLRARVTRRIREGARLNYHEHAHGIRWVVLAVYAALALVAVVRPWRRRWLGEPEQRRLAWFALGLGAAAFVLSLGPDSIRVGDRSFGPILLFAKIFPAFRIANRVGVLLHFAALIGAGVALDAFARHAATPRARHAWSAGFLALVVLEYLPLHPVLLAPVPLRRPTLAPASAPERCGAGITVPYVTHGFDAEDYYRAVAELRGTSCKLLHSGYATKEDDALRARLSSTTYDEAALERSVAFARCTNASFVLFRLEPPESFRRELCARLGWSFVTPDACRGEPASAGPPRLVRECIP